MQSIQGLKAVSDEVWGLKWVGISDQIWFWGSEENLPILDVIQEVHVSTYLYLGERSLETR